MSVSIKFLGTTGYYPLHYQSSCILVETSSANFILDAGTGICRLPASFDYSKPTFLLLSHFHLDHSVGLMYLRGVFKGESIAIVGQPGTEKNVRTLLGKPFFGTGLETFPFGITFIEVNEGSGLLGDAKVTSKALVHSDLVYGYRIEADGKSVCYCTDTAPCAQVRELARDADVLIHEAYFDEDDAQATGALEVHSSPTAAASAALNAHAKRLYLFHFHPEYDEKRRRAMEAAGRAVFKETRASYDWLTLAL